jgi:hypothetical protein
MSLTTDELTTLALSTSQVAALGSISPLVLDLSGNGIQTVGLAQSGVKFDLNNSGLDASVGWITPGEGFLVHLPTGANTITNGSELFGTATVLSNGQTATNGFAALSAFDINNNGVINSSDPIFNQLQVWVDTGNNGSTPTGTLFTLAQLNIQSLNLNATFVNQANNGNTIGLVSSYTTTNGKTYEMADVWLSSTAATNSASSQLSQILTQYQNSSATPSASSLQAQAINASAGVMSSALGSALTNYSNVSVTGAVSLTPPNVTTQLIAPNATPTTTLTQTATKNSS